MRTGNHLGNPFRVWNNRRGWFWMVANHPGGGAIGAAATEAEAIREASMTIEELSANSQSASVLRLASPALDWNCTLTNLNRYLAGSIAVMP